MLIMILVITKKFKELFRDLYYKETTIDDVERKQDEFSAIITALEKYIPKDDKYVGAKNKLLNNVKNFYEGREKIIEGFKNEIFSFYYEEEYEKQMRFKREEAEEEKRRRRKEKKEKQKEESEKKKFFEHIENETKDIDDGLFDYYFNFVKPSDLTKKLFEIKDKKKNNDFVEEIKNR